MLVSPSSITSLHLSINPAVELSVLAGASVQVVPFPAKYTNSPTPMTRQTTSKRSRTPTNIEIKQPFFPLPGVSSAWLLYFAMSEKSNDSALPIAKVIRLCQFVPFPIRAHATGAKRVSWWGFQNGRDMDLQKVVRF